MSFVLRRTLIVAALACTLGLAAAPAQAKLGPRATDTQLASEFLRLLHTQDSAGLKKFLDPAFLTQRADGSYLTKAQYLKNPAVVQDYTVSDVFGTRHGNVRVLRYTVVTSEIINGQQMTDAPVARLSTFVRHGKTWRLIAHANFIAPAS